MRPISIREIRDEIYKQLNRKYKAYISKVERDYNLMCLKYHFTCIEKYHLIRENQELKEKLKYYEN